MEIICLTDAEYCDTIYATDCRGGEVMSDVTIYTLAEELNMSPSMVSRAFNPNGKISEEKRQIVLKAAKKYDFSPNKFASRLSMKTVRIGILINSRFAINIDKMILGAKNAYEKLKDYKITYDIEVMNSGVNTLDDYRKVLCRYREFDGVILTGMSSARYTDIINELYKFNPNIAQVQAINRNADYLFASKHNEETASCLAAEFLYNCLKWKERKNVMLITGDKESALHSDAEIAFKDVCKDFGLKILDSIDMKDDEKYFSEILPGIFDKYAEKIDGIYVTSGFSAPLCRFMEENGIDVPLVSFDTYDDIKTYMKKGIISATIAQNVTKQMESAFEMLVNHLITGEACPEKLYTDIQLVLKSNIHQFE